MILIFLYRQKVYLKILLLIFWVTILYKAMLGIPFWCFYFIRFAQASQYVTNSIESVQLLAKDSHDIGARSPIECILKCGNRFQKKGFYTNDKSCFCLNGTTSGRAGKSKSGFDGNLYLKREIESKLIFF